MGWDENGEGRDENGMGKYKKRKENFNPICVFFFCKIKSETLDYFFDTTPNKTGKYMPHSHIYIKRYNKPLTNEADYVFLGAWNFKEEIFKKERKYIKKGGKFITHIPVPKII